MEWKFNKDLCPYYCNVLDQKQMQEQTQEVRLADGMPDIGRVLGCRGQVLIRSKEWHADQVSVNGGVLTKVLYVPEDGSEVRSVDCWLPLQMKWDLPQVQREGIVHLQPVLRSVDARALSARKLMVRSVVGMQAKAMVAMEAEVYAPAQPEEDLQLLKQTYPLTMLRETGEKTFSMDEELTVPEGMNPLRRVLTACLEPVVTDSKVLAGRLVFRGEAKLHMLYCDAEGAVCNMDTAFAFSQYAQLDRDHSPHAQADTDVILTSMEVEADPEGRIRVQCGMSAQYAVCDRVMLEVVTDAYSLRRPVEQTVMPLDIPVCLDRITREIPVSKVVPAGAKRVVDITWHPDLTGGLRHSEGTQIELQGAFDVLYQDENGALQGHTARFEESILLTMDPQNHISAQICQGTVPEAVLTDDTMTLCGSVMVDVAVSAGAGIGMVTQLELGAQQPPDPARPSLILRRACRDSLWEIAKECGSTVAAIRQANHLEGEPAPDTLVLVPVS